MKARLEVAIVETTDAQAAYVSGRLGREHYRTYRAGKKTAWLEVPVWLVALLVRCRVATA